MNTKNEFTVNGNVMSRGDIETYILNNLNKFCIYCKCFVKRVDNFNHMLDFVRHDTK